MVWFAHLANCFQQPMRNNCTVFTLSFPVGNCTNSCLVVCLPRHLIVTQDISMSLDIELHVLWVQQ